jgi:AraC-like DNA-binding protein
MAAGTQQEHATGHPEVSSGLQLYRVRVPTPPLADFLAVLWHYEGAPLPHAKERLLPTGTMELVIIQHEDVTRLYDRDTFACTGTMPGAVLCGAYDEHFVIDTDEQTSVVGAHFRAGGAWPFFGVHGSELHNVHVPLDALWGEAGARELRERVLAAPTSDAKFDVLETVLLSRLRAGRLRAGPDRHPAVAWAVTRFREVPHVTTVSDVVAAAGLSARRFIELFRREVGLTPKVFCRVCRFQEVVRRTAGGRAVRWADVAAACGYFDQSHFIHDFRAFAGISPSDYSAQGTPHMNHVPIPD